MNILLTNDDGIRSPGLQALYDVLAIDNDVWVIAPDRERSGSSSSISVKSPFTITAEGRNCYSCSGTPSDCVLIAEDLLKFSPDVVVSGINLGANVGPDICYSGTVAAARQAVYLGIPGIALSVPEIESKNVFYFDTMLTFISGRLVPFKEMSNNRYVVNINAPNSETHTQEYRMTIPSSGKIRPLYDITAHTDTQYFCQHKSITIFRQHEPDSDVCTLRSGKISVSLVDTFYPSTVDAMQQYSALLE